MAEQIACTLEGILFEGEERVARQVLKHVVMDSDEPGYTDKPLYFAPEPDSLARVLFNDVINAQLDKLIGAQQPDGGWPISGPTVSAANECEYRGIATLNALKALRAYGRW